MHAVSGLIVTLIGELFCEGTPFSTTANGSIEYGQPLTKAETFALAAEKFTTAASKAAGEVYCRAAAVEKVETVILRLANVYGVGHFAGGTKLPQWVPVARQSSALLTTVELT